MAPANTKELIEYRLDQVDKRFDEVIEGINRLDDRLEEVCTSNDTRLSSLETGKDVNKTRIDGLSRDIERLHGRLNLFTGIETLWATVLAVIAGIFGK